MNREYKAEIIEQQDGTCRYFDKNGTELHDGDSVKWESGTIKKLYATEEGYLGTDATNPYWIESGYAVECQFGVYPLNWNDMEEIVKVEAE